jgi:predicted ATPase
VLGRLANLAGSFTLDAAEAGAVSDDTPASAVVNLAAKSLIFLEHFENSAHYRMLDTTRDYVRQKLREC